MLADTTQQDHRSSNQFDFFPNQKKTQKDISIESQFKTRHIKKQHLYYLKIKL